MGCACSDKREFPEGKDKSEMMFLEIINEHIQEHTILLYTLSDCENSRKAKSFCRSRGLEFEYYDLDKLNDDRKILKTLQKITDFKGKSLVFYTGEYQGGLQEFQQLVS